MSSYKFECSACFSMTLKIPAGVSRPFWPLDTGEVDVICLHRCCDSCPSLALCSSLLQLLLHQHSRLVARQRVRVFQSNWRLTDEHRSLPARSDPPRSAIRLMEHTRQSISPIAVNRNATAFLYYTLMFRMFVAIYVMSSLFRVLRFVLRRWRVLLR
jgi:hypothetical protein